MKGTGAEAEAEAAAAATAEVGWETTLRAGMGAGGAGRRAKGSRGGGARPLRLGEPGWVGLGWVGRKQGFGAGAVVAIVNVRCKWS